MMISAAIISECGKYRFRLIRTWDPTKPQLTFCMLNPSTADASKDDPTIRRCIGFAKRDGYGGITVVNLFPFRSSKPSDLIDLDIPRDIWVENERHQIEVLRIAALCGAKVVAAWGTKYIAHTRGHDFWTLSRHVYMGLHCAGKIAGDLPTHPLWCLGHGTVNCGCVKATAPKHPLYIPADQPFEGFR